jgi:hypothetical protein
MTSDELICKYPFPNIERGKRNEKEEFLVIICPYASAAILGKLGAKPTDRNYDLLALIHSQISEAAYLA